jgi:ferrous iron transport protein A
LLCRRAKRILIVIRVWSDARVLKRVESVRPARARPAEVAPGAVAPLGHGARGFRGRVSAVGTGGAARALDQADLERRLLEIGFVEGAAVHILHEGAIGGDPIVVKVDDMRVALRRGEADAVMVRREGGRVRGDGR